MNPLRSRLILAYATAAAVIGGAAAWGADHRDAPLTAPPPLHGVEEFATGLRMGMLVRVDLEPPGAALPVTLLWTDSSHGTVRYVLEP
mgnify:CR=1 FL=1